MAKYAAKTKVPVPNSKVEVERILKRYGASAIGMMESANGSMVVFELFGRRIRMDVPFLEDAQEQRRVWRVLVLRLKARLEAIEGGDTTVDEEFLPYLCIPGGGTVAQVMIPQIEQMYAEGKEPRLLLEYE